MLDNDNIKHLFKKDILLETEDNKAILLIKDEDEEIVGGYEWDVYNKNYTNLTLLNKSIEKPLFFKSTENESKSVFLYNDIVSPLYMMNTVNTAYTNNIENLENIDKVKKYNIKIGSKQWDKNNYKELLKSEYIKKPFIPKEKGNNEELYSFLLSKTNIPKQRLVEMFKKNHIYQDVDRMKREKI